MAFKGWKVFIPLKEKIDDVTKCYYCGEEEYLPFQCHFCGYPFCVDHRLPPSHNCVGVADWKARGSPSKLEQAYTAWKAKSGLLVYDRRRIMGSYIEGTPQRRKIRKVAIALFLISLVALATVS